MKIENITIGVDRAKAIDYLCENSVDLHHLLSVVSEDNQPIAQESIQRISNRYADIVAEDTRDKLINTLEQENVKLRFDLIKSKKKNNRFDILFLILLVTNLLIESSKLF